MLKDHYTVFNWKIIDKVNNIIKSYNFDKPITQIRITRSKTYYKNLVPTYEQEAQFLETTDIFLNSVIEEPVISLTTNIPAKSMQEAIVLSPYAKTLLEEVEASISQPLENITTDKTYPLLSSLIDKEPLLKNAFDHFDQQEQEKYKKILEN